MRFQSVNFFCLKIGSCNSFDKFQVWSSELFLMKHKSAHTPPPSQLIFSVNSNDLESYQTDVGKLITELITK